VIVRRFDQALERAEDKVRTKEREADELRAKFVRASKEAAGLRDKVSQMREIRPSKVKRVMETWRESTNSPR